MHPITDKLIDQLQDEMREIAHELRAEVHTLPENDDVKANNALAFNLDEIADNRLMLARFAVLLRRHHDKHSAIAELTGARVAA